MRRIFSKLFLSLIFLAHSLELYCQNSAQLKFERINAEQGLTSNRINGIVQDLSGFLWIATNSGLNRFDGIEIKKYTKQYDDSSSLSNNTILTQYCDSKSQLWVLTINYLHRYNKKLDNFDRFQLSDKRESSRYGNKGVITADKSGTIWIGTPTNGLFVFDRSTNQCKKVLPEVSAVSSLFFDDKANLWIGGENGVLICYNLKTKSVNQYQVPGKLRRTLIEDFIRKIWQGDSGKLNLLLSSGFFQFDPSIKMFSTIADWNNKVNYSINELRSLYIDKQMMWIGTQGSGLYILDLLSGKVFHHQSVSNNPGSLSNNSITGILKDRNGVYWITTSDGLNKFDPTIMLFAHYQKDPNNQNSLHYNFVSSFCESPDGKIWIGTFGQGISVFDRKNETFQIIKNAPGNSESLVNDAVRALVPDGFGNIWIGTTNGLSKYNLKNKHFTNYKSTEKKGSPVSDDITSLLVSKDNKLYVGTNGSGVSVCNLNPFTANEFKTYGTTHNFLSSGRVRKIIEISNGTIAFGTLGGGINYLLKEKIKKQSLSEFSKSVDSDYINALCEDQDKNLWVGTWDGLFLLDSALTIRKQFNIIDGMPANEISGILSDSSGDIWVSSMNGLSHLTKIKGTDYKIINYSPNNGLQGSYFTTYSTLKTQDGEMYFGGYNGFNRFYPEKITLNKKAPKVIFTDFQVFNQSVPINQSVNGRLLLSENITETREIILNYKHQIIGFRFAALTTSQVEKVKYACKMKGIDPDWVYLDYNQRNKSYNNLPPGEYIFTVKACNADGIWDSQGTSIKIKVLTPFWKSWWAYLFYGLLIIGFVYLAREYSLSRARLENKAVLERVHREKDAEINNLKIKFFINISHEIRTPLSLIISPLEKLLRTESMNQDIKKHLSTMYGNAQRLLNLINQLLDFRKIETGNIHLHVARYDVVAFVSETKKAFEESTVQKDITLTFEANEKTLFLWFDPDSMEKILFNLLSNAIKFTQRGGSIHMYVNHLPEKDQCEIQIRDTGIGVPAEKIDKLFDRFYQVENKNFLKQDSVGSGIGLSIVKSLVEIHKGKISVESVEGEFTSFRIVFRTGKTHLEKNDYITISEKPVPYSFNIFSITPIMADDEASEFPGFEPGPKKKKEHKILIVEDNAEIRYYLRQSLQNNYEIIEAENGNVGREQAIQHIPDLIITDVMMPELNGIELCHILKTEMLTQHIPIFILSAKSTIEDMVEGLETGADDYIPKPFNEKILQAKIKTLIVNRQKLIDKYQNHQIKADLLKEPSDALSFDDPFINRVVDFIKENLSDESLNNEKIEAHFKTNKMQLYRKLKAVTGWSVNSLIREIRTRTAIDLLRHSEKNISEIAYQIGFSDPLYFSKLFKKETEVSPNQYRKDFRNKIS